jgi:gamma-glutamyltranspeptidase / glutathione hydrolase
MKDRNKMIFGAGLIFILILIVTISFGAINNQAEESYEFEQASITDIPEQVEKPESTIEYAEAVVSSHYLATEAGIEILARGGSAADAALTVGAVMTVVEPFFSSVLGGGTWALYYDADTDKITSQDGVGPVGSLASVEDFAARGGQAGIHQAVVPGAWDGWMLWFEKYGELDLDEVLEPAIRIAREGFPVSNSVAAWLKQDSRLIANRPDTAAIYMPNGKLLQAGDIAYQNDLANTFERLVEVYTSNLSRGRSEAIQAVRDYFYRGPIAKAIVEFSETHGGYLNIDDFQNFEAQIVEPIYIQYNDELKVYQNPPNSQGLTNLVALNILKGFDFSELGPDDAEAVHLQVEALKLAFADRYYHVGDPARVNVPVRDLLSDEYASKQRDRICMESAMRWPIEDGLKDHPSLHNTTTFHVVDRNGNAAAVTTSIGAQFLVIGDTGIHINDRMRMLSLNNSEPNLLTPGFKVRHTANPYMVFKNGNLYIVGGVTGADNQPQGQVQQFMNIVEFELSAQEAVNRPRFATTSFPSVSFPYRVGNQVLMHSGFQEGCLSGLRSIGHEVVIGGMYGSSHVIVVSEDGLYAETGAEPRDDTSLGLVNPGKMR